MNPLLRRWITLCFVAILAISTIWHVTDLSRFDLVPGLGKGPKRQAPIDWSQAIQHYPVSSFHQLPGGTPILSPKIQAAFPTESADHTNERLERRDAVKEAFVHSWRGYSKYAW